MNSNKDKRLIKFFIVALAAVVLACAIVIFTACKHEHKYTPEVTLQPTCTRVGEMTYKCTKCKDSYTQELPLTDHNYAIQCSDIEHWQVCTVCLTETTHEAHDHSIVQSVLPATCHSTGMEIRVCVCGDEIHETLPVLEHSFTVKQRNADKHWLKCANCSAISEESSHKFGAPVIVTASTCTIQGNQKMSCECGEEKIETLPLIEHSFTKIAFDGEGHWLACAACGEANPNQSKMAHNIELVVTKQPNCIEKGRKTIACDVCDYSVAQDIDALGHDLNTTEFSAESTADGHYYKCDRCGNDILRSHDWITKREEPTCTENGEEWSECNVCNVKKSGSDKTLTKLGHDYETFEVISTATCKQAGQEIHRCKLCGDMQTVQIAQLKHAWDAYAFDNNGHWKKCIYCGTEQDVLSKSKHTVDKTVSDVVVQEGDCVTDRIVLHVCQFCKCEYTETIKAKGHSYITTDPTYTDSSKFADPTCTEYGWHMETCSICGDEAKKYGNTLEEHQVEYYLAKEMTETEAGNRPYWQCNVCKRYFSSKDCHEELFEKDIFSYPPKVIEIAKIDDLVIIALQQEDDTTSEDFYIVTGWIFDINYINGIVTLVDDNSETTDFTVKIPNNVDRYSLQDYDIITVKGRLYVLNDEDELAFSFEECTVLSVKNSSEKYDLYVEVIGLDNANLSITYGDDYYLYNTVYFNTLESNGNKLKISCSKYNANSPVYLVRFTVNGIPTAMNNGVWENFVSADMHIVMEFSIKSPVASVTISKVDTSDGMSNDVILDSYVSYTYRGGSNEEGRLYYGSKLTFYVQDAKIVGINITYESEWLEGNPDEVNNKIVAKTSGGGEFVIPQGEANKRNKVVIELDVSKGYVELTYFADCTQARITEITLLYETTNKLATY